MHRRVWLLVAAFAALALAMGTGGFSAAQIDRGVSVNVVEHDEAFVGLADPGARRMEPEWVPSEYRYETPVTQNDPTARLFVVRNGLSDGELRVTARDGDNGEVDLLDVETELVGPTTGPQAVSGTVDCPANVHGPARLDLTVVVDGPDGGLHAEIDYPVTVVCASDASTPTPESGEDEDGESG